MKKGLLAAGFFLLLATLMVREGLFTERVGICIDALYTIKPWSELPYEGLKDYNPAHAHQAFFLYPWMRYALDQLGAGKIPLWTHLAGGGAPFMGNLSCACFFPLNWLGLVVPLETFWSLLGLLKLWLGALLTYGLLRIYRLRMLSCLFGALAFGFSGFQICWMNHPHSNVALFLPALFLGVELFHRRRNGAAVVVNALVLFLQSLGGSPETSFLLFFAWGLYLLYRIRHEVELFSADGFRLIFFGALAGLLGAALAAFQLWPFFEYLVHSYGLEMRIRDWDEFLNGGPGRLLTPFGIFMGLLFPLFLVATIGLLQRKNTLFVGLWSGVLGGLCLIVALRIAFWLGAKPHLLIQVLPELYGPPSGGSGAGGDISYSALNGGYAGVISAFLALYTFVAPCKRRPLPFFIFLFIFSFGAAHCIPWLVHAVKIIPLLGWVHNSSLFALTAFSVAVIAPFGLEDLISRAANIQGRSAAIGGVVTAFIVVCWSVIPAGWDFFDTGMELFEAERDLNPGVVITAPENPTKQNGLEPLCITGRAAKEVKTVQCYLDGLFAGEVRTEEAPAGSAGNGVPSPGADTVDPALRKAYPRIFSLTYLLDTLDEGTYKAVVTPSKFFTDDPLRTGGDGVDVRMVRLKRVTMKDLLILALSTLAFLLLLTRKLPERVRSGMVVAVLIVDLCLFGMGYNKTSRPEDLYPPTRITDFLMAREGPFRIFSERDIMHPNTNFPYGIEHMEWDDRLGIAGYWKVCNHIKLDHLAKPRELNVYNFNLDHPLVDFIGVRYVLVESEVDLSRYLKKFTQVFEDGSLRIYENGQARERAFIVGDWITLQDHPIEDVLKSNLRNQPVLHHNPPIRKGGRGTVEILSYESDRIHLAAVTEGQALLVLTDNFFPGWKAFVDGVETPILKTTATFRAIPLAEEGRHEVEFVYRPWSFYGGIYIALAALILCILLVVVPVLTAPMSVKSDRVL